MSDPQSSSGATGQRVEARTASFGELGTTPAGATGTASLDTLLDISLPVSVEFGSTRMTVQEILDLAAGSVIQLDRLVGESIDVYVSDQKLAEGEVVVIGEHFGVRITRIVSSALPEAGVVK